jgi:integrase
MACITIKRDRLVIDFYDQHGKRRLKTLPKGTTKGTARKVLREIEQEIERGTFLTTGNTPVFSDVSKNWLKYKKPNIRHTTYIQYAGHINNHLTPYFGATKINRINFNTIEKYISYASERKVNPSTLKKILITLGGILKYSVRKKYLDSNPIREIEKPKNKSCKKEVDFLKPEEIRGFIEATDDQKYKAMFLMAIMTGMRQGELLGLKWDDIDWFNCQVRVKRTYNHGRFFEPKSETSKRAIDLSPIVISELKKWQLACLPNELNLIFPDKQ